MDCVDKSFFGYLETFSLENILKYADPQIVTVLPLLTRCCLCSSSFGISQQQEQQQQHDDDQQLRDNNAMASQQVQQSFFHQQRQKKQHLMKALLGYSEVNFLIESLSTDFNEVTVDCSNQLTLR